ncbi:hypothetical protein NEUTE1DRAFT_147678 [Neurospora tetrasperma FGSC 2508]|uniref:Rhodopsin domain-containing protein n=1 Tax=Neurospora tetrasperma (strain FGSC 2508 / ATCC MYA-4615 / P0657) TaxID=510951 RepID=F8MS90_NEUT8|nr:uncharacterized protein NEUTE1DRAFT_147678 [Neurospora tetrasperma FGSC 2508]EGO55031.1 hypothetical protein NEUTE1DRAFT_147678 [Neurospora tetrasperma FGSC 2508]EGZ69763.1 hypothetical protein NEUTE2DRAFT_116526 [Neurospora tetrasperma FGSC 2509]
MASTVGAAASSFVEAAAHHAVNAIHLEGRRASGTVQVIPDHRSRVALVNFSCWFLTAFATLFLGLRIYCKRYRGRGLWWDDYVLILSWISLTTSSALISYSTTLGFGLPTSLFNPTNSIPFLNHYLLITNFAGTFSILAALWSKTSFAITVLRIAQDDWIRYLIIFIMISVNLSLGVAVGLTWGQCDPIPKIWQPYLPGTCIDKSIQIHYNIFTAVYSGTMDIVLAVLPWKIIWILTMNKPEKVGITVAMSMGVFAGCASIIKASELPTIGNSNFTFASTNLVIWGIAESAITVVAASIPILRALLKDMERGSRLPPPPPAEFYNLTSLESESGNGNQDQNGQEEGGGNMEGMQGTTTQGTGGTGSMTVTGSDKTGQSSKKRGLFGSLSTSLTRGSKGSSRSRSSSDGRRDGQEAANGHGDGRPAEVSRLSRLSRELSVETAEGFSRGDSDDTVNQPSVNGGNHGGGVGTVHAVMDPQPTGRSVNGRDMEVTIAYDQDQTSPTRDSHTRRMSEWLAYQTYIQGSDADLAHVHAIV